MADKQDQTATIVQILDLIKDDSTLTVILAAATVLLILALVATLFVVFKVILSGREFTLGSLKIGPHPRSSIGEADGAKQAPATSEVPTSKSDETLALPPAATSILGTWEMRDWRHDYAYPQ